MYHKNIVKDGKCMNVWKNSYSPDIVLDPLTSEDIALAENTFNVKLCRADFKSKWRVFAPYVSSGSF